MTRLGARARTRPRLAVAVALLGLLVGPPAAHAGSADVGPRAEAHNTQGKAAYRDGRFLEALRFFQLASAVHASPRYTYNIARTLERLERWTEATETYRRYLKEAPEAEDAEDVRLRIQVLLRKAELSRGRIAVEIETDPPGAEIWVGDPPRRAGTTPSKIELPLNVKTAVELRKEGYLPAVESLAGGPDTPRRMKFRLVARAVEAPAPGSKEISGGPAPPEARGRYGIWKWSTAGGSLVGAGLGIYFLARGRSLARDAESIDQQRRGGGYGQADFDRKLKSARTANTVGWVLVGTGVALAATSAVLFVLDGGSPARDTSSGRLRLAPLALPGGGGISLGWGP